MSSVNKHLDNITLEVALERLHELEERFNWALSALELMGSLTQFQTVVNRGDDVEIVIRETCQKVEQIIPVKTIAFMFVSDEDASFQLEFCTRDDQKIIIQKLIDQQVKDGMFAWAVQQNRAICININDNKHTLILHSITTPTKICGMFVALSENTADKITDISLRMLTMILSSTASALESHDLNRIIHEQNRNLANIVKDRTRQLEAALNEAEKANIAKSVFLANMSHELRTPLNAILGYAEIMAEDAQDAGNDYLVDDLQKIGSAGSHLLALINDLLDLSKIEAGRLDLDWADCSIKELISHIKIVAPPLAAKRNNEFTIENRTKIESFFTDPLRLRQSLLNLISNAFKFTSEGCVNIIFLEREINDETHICIQVSDNGIGIDMSKAHLVFDAFAQAEASTTRKYGGTGLGLTITRRLCNMMGGDVTLESEIEKGSTFTIVLPYLTSPPADSAQAEDD